MVLTNCLVCGRRRGQLLEGELKAKIEELSELKHHHHHHHQSESSRPVHVTCDQQQQQHHQQQQPAFTSSPAYKSLMTSVGLGSNTAQVRTRPLQLPVLRVKATFT